MTNYIESLKQITSRDPEQEVNYRIEKPYPLSPGNAPVKKAKHRPGFKKENPLCNWTMPAQPAGYIRAGKYDLL